MSMNDFRDWKYEYERPYKLFSELTFKARKDGIVGKLKRDANLSYSPAFYIDNWDVDYLPMFKTVGDPEEPETKLSAGLVAYYSGYDMKVELYHEPYEHMAGDAYSYWDDNPKKAVERLQQHNPKRGPYPIFGYEERISVSADVTSDFFAIQELGMYIVPERGFSREKTQTRWEDKQRGSIPIEYPQPPASTFPYGVPDIKHTTYFQDFEGDEEFKGVKTMNDTEIRWNYNHLYSYVISGRLVS